MLQYNFIIDILNGGVDMEAKIIPKNILKIQQKLSTYEIGSRNYKKYQKILSSYKVTSIYELAIFLINTLNRDIKKISGY